ncbi:hypothetical protein BTVI_120681 [Pitangus sulphuratus]|nr:hypothetical protein BTVI_120681 [Pitangus sulphuratus]
MEAPPGAAGEPAGWAAEPFAEPEPGAEELEAGGALDRVLRESVCQQQGWVRVYALEVPAEGSGVCAIPGNLYLQCPGDGAGQVLEVKLNSRIRLVMKSLEEEEEVLYGAWRGLTTRLPGRRIHVLAGGSEPREGPLHYVRAQDFSGDLSEALPE